MVIRRLCQQGGRVGLEARSGAGLSEFMYLPQSQQPNVAVTIGGRWQCAALMGTSGFRRQDRL